MTREQERLMETQRNARLAHEAAHPAPVAPTQPHVTHHTGPTHRSRIYEYLELVEGKGMTADEGVQWYEADVNDGRPLGNIVPQLLSQMEKEGEVVVIGFRPTRRGKNASVYALRKYANAGTGQV